MALSKHERVRIRMFADVAVYEDAAETERSGYALSDADGSPDEGWFHTDEIDLQDDARAALFERYYREAWRAYAALG